MRYRWMVVAVSLLLLIAAVPLLGGAESPVSSPTKGAPAPSLSGLLYTPGCSEYVSNGGFETNDAWYIPLTAYSAGYSTVVVNCGSRSMRLGIVEPLDNRHSYSGVNQQISIPADALTVTLRYSLYTISGDAGPVPTPQPRMLGGDPRLMDDLSYDVQYLLILDKYDNWIDTVMWHCADDQIWVYHEYDLSAYAGQTIKLHFGVYNTGLGGVTAMYLDNVSLEVCRPITPTPTETLIPTETPIPTDTLTPTPVTPTCTPTCTPTTLPSVCPDILLNGGFEADSAWYIPATHYSADYSTARAYMGTRAMRLGIVAPLDNRYSYSDVNQQVAIPSNATSVTLCFYAYPASDDAGVVPTPYPRMMADSRLGTCLPYDVQYLLLLDKYDNWIDTIMWHCADDQTWVYHQYDLSAYAGQTIKLQFGAYNTGSDGITLMYLDEVSLQVCTPVTPTPTARPANMFLPLIYKTYSGSAPAPTQTPTGAPTPTPTATSSAYPYPAP